MSDGHLELQDRDLSNGHRAPIDLFFRTLAETHGRNAAAVVLSGSGADGAIGVQRIKEQGGVVLVQEPQEAQFDPMPRNAIATGLVDYVLPVAAMPGRLVAYWHNATIIRLPPIESPRVDNDADVLGVIFALLRARTGHDFSQYKRATLLRRIGRRMQVNTVTDLVSYLGVLRTRTDEVQALLRDLLISVTNFFRDASVWERLETIIPNLFAGKDASDQVRVWVAGCATGEEAYSVAMLLYEYASTRGQHFAIQVFATDIDEEAINVARTGLYAETIAADVSSERLQRFFIAEQGRYRIKKEIRDLVLFAPHNVLRDSPFSRLDLVTCRNLLIYLNRDVQEQILGLFHFVLRSEGYLLLGASESTEGLPNMFEAIDKPQRLFQRRAMSTVAPQVVPVLPLFGRRRRSVALSKGLAEGPPPSFSDLDLHALAFYGPARMIINEEYEIVHLARGAGRFLTFTDGELSSNLLKLIQPRLRLELRTALFSAVQTNTSSETRLVRLDVDGASRLISITVQPIQEPAWGRGYMLILFNEMPDDGDIIWRSVSDAEPLVHQLETELQRTKDQLRTTIEQYETAVEEYKAANEELQAINEELRAATEELETGKEELQSVNEELTTVNQELKYKVEEISQSNNDLQNLMASTEIGTIFVDRELRIKRYTPSTQAIFNLIPTDINRPLIHVTHRLNNASFGQDATKVLETLEKIEREVPSQDGRWYLARLLPYRTAEDRIDGVILTFVDITSRKQAEEALRESERRLMAILQQIPAGVLIAEPSGKLIFGNQQIEAIFQQPFIAHQELRSYWIDRLFYPASGKPFALEQILITRTLAHGETVTNEELELRNADESLRYVSVNTAPVRDANGKLMLGVATFIDITALRESDAALRAAHTNLEQRVVDRTSEIASSNERLQLEATERQRAEASRREMLRHLVTAQEEERRRIARELHDQLGQLLSALRLDLKSLTDAPSDPDQAAQIVARLQHIAAQLDGEIDRLALELRPAMLDDLGLRGALQQHLEEWTEHNSIVVEFQSTGVDVRPLPSDVEIAIYRVVQEALTNVLKHAQAQHVSVIVEQGCDHIHAIVEDDGRGFDPEAAQNRLGLLGMQERAALVGGTVTIESAPEQGTTVFIRIPLTSPLEDHGHE